MHWIQTYDNKECVNAEIALKGMLKTQSQIIALYKN